jgi:subtilisin family serine protease
LYIVVKSNQLTKLKFFTMKKTFNRIFSAILTSSVFFACQQDAENFSQFKKDRTVVSEEYEVIPGQYIVTLNDDVAAGRFEPRDFQQAQSTMREVAEEFKSVLNDNAQITRVYGSTIKGFVGAGLSESDVEVLKNDSRVKRVEPDFIMMRPPWERDPGGGDDGGGSAGQSTPYGITRVNGGITYTGSNVAWILDSGIDLDHPDLNVDASRGFNAFTSGRDGKSLDDGDGHGTHVAGTIAAIDNTAGVIGVAAGATVIPVKVLDSRGSGSFSGVIGGVDWVGANGSPGDVANMSLGGGAVQSLDDAVVAASSNGIWFCLAAGNSATDANTSSPARANGQYVVTISAMDSNDRFASFSNYGNPPIDFCAPGVGTESTWKDGGYNTISGTSMATPHAAGVLLLGAARTDGNVIGDPDGNPDPIIVH